MQELNNHQSKVVFYLRKLAACVEANALWLLCCLPIVTIGASTSAFYATMHGAIRRDRDTVWGNFRRVFKAYFGKATRAWLILFSILAAAACGWVIINGVPTAGQPVGIGGLLLLIPVLSVLAVGAYCFPYLVRFETDVRHIIKNSALLAVRNLHWTLLMLVLYVLGAWSLTFVPVMIFLVPSIVCLVDELILERIFRRIMRPEDLRKELKREQRERR